MERLSLITVEADAPLLKAVHLMMKNNVGSLPVLDEGKLVGIIRMNEVFQEIANVLTTEGG